MQDNMMAFKAGVVAFFTAVGALLGWQGVMIVIWVGAMLLDYLTGSAAALKSGQWSSATARQGLWHKGGMIVVVVVAAVADVVMVIICDHIPLGMTWPILILPLVLAWYILTELGSILENAIKMGAPIPKWLVKLLKVGVNLIDRKGEESQTPVADEESQTPVADEEDQT
jgi:toxin secretion/phage lysis holin